MGRKDSSNSDDVGVYNDDLSIERYEKSTYRISGTQRSGISESIIDSADRQGRMIKA